MDLTQKYFTILAMIQFGGRFIRALATAYEAADARNTERIEKAFPEVLEFYGPGSTFYAEVGGQHE